MGISRKSKEQRLLEDLTKKMKGVLDSQAVLRDGLAEIRKTLKTISKTMDGIEANSEVVRISLRRKANMEEIKTLEKKIYDLEEKLAALQY